MDGVNMYLTLVAFGSANFDGGKKIIPIFPAIYGGYFFGMELFFSRQISPKILMFFPPKLLCNFNLELNLLVFPRRSQ